MITQSYTDERESLISPGNFCGEKRHICDIAVATFSNEILEAVLERYPHQEVAQIGSANGRKPVYRVSIQDREIIFYLSSIGSAIAGNDIIEVQWQTGVSSLVIFGSAGSLDSEATTGKYVIPSSAVRDEGMSYHYAPPADYIEIKNHQRVASVFEKHRLPYVTGRVWTTDAPYRETCSAVEKRKSEGCVAVEMEAAGLQAVCDFYGIELYCFLVTGDTLDGEEYDPSGLGSANHSLDKFWSALKIVEEIGGII